MVATPPRPRLHTGLEGQHLVTTDVRGSLPRRRTLQQPARAQDTLGTACLARSPGRVTTLTPDVQLQFHCGMSSVGGEFTRTAICHADAAIAALRP